VHLASRLRAPFTRSSHKSSLISTHTPRSKITSAFLVFFFLVVGSVVTARSARLRLGSHQLVQKRRAEPSQAVKLAQLVARAVARVPFLEGRASAVQRWSRFLLVVLCLVSAVASYVSSPPLCCALHRHRCHFFLCLVSITSRAVACSCACHHHRRRCLMRFIAIAPCTSSPSHRPPRRRRPAPLVAVTLRAVSLLPCAPHRHCPAPLVTGALLPSPHRPASPLARAPP